LIKSSDLDSINSNEIDNLLRNYKQWEKEEKEKYLWFRLYVCNEIKLYLMAKMLRDLYYDLTSNCLLWINSGYIEIQN